MQPNELTLEAQMFDAKINSMDKTCLLAPLSFFYACNVSTDEERLRRMMLLRTRALQLGISEQEYADRRDNYTSQFDADPSYCLKIARMALRRQAMQELGFTPMAWSVPDRHGYMWMENWWIPATLQDKVEGYKSVLLMKHSLFVVFTIIVISLTSSPSRRAGSPKMPRAATGACRP